VNYKFLPIGGTDMWSHYPTANPFMNDLLMQPAAEVQAPAGQERPVSEEGEDIMIGSPRAAGPPAEDYMIGSSQAVGTPTVETPAAPQPPEDLAANDAWARYKATVAASEQRTYTSPSVDTLMAEPTH
jgi:hypothetical protein